MKRYNKLVIGILCLVLSQLSIFVSADNAVGGMGGQFSVSSMGGAIYSIPIEVPQGVAGLQPGISITYNSQAGNGICGYGTNLSGFSLITRGPKDIYHDDAAYGMEYDTDDAFYLDGVRLIHSSGTQGQDGAVYYPESDPYTQVVLHVVIYSGSNHMWFEVINRAGIKCRYGYSSGRQTYIVGNNQKTMAWYLDYMEDTFGNEMVYSFKTVNNVMYPDSITYGMNNQNVNDLRNYVCFNYETRQDASFSKYDGVNCIMDRRLSSITTLTGDSIYRQYILGYDTSSDGTAYKFSRLTGVTEKNGWNESLPATQLAWSYLPAEQKSCSSLTVSTPSVYPFVSFPFTSQTFQAGDLNGDGLTDLVGIAPVMIPNNQGGNDYKTCAYVYYASVDVNGNTQFVSGHNYILPASFQNSDLIGAGVEGLSVVDVDGDGINELLLPYLVRMNNSNSTLSFYVLGQNYSDYVGISHGLYGTEMPLYYPADFNVDGRGDVVFLETTATSGSYPMSILHYNTAYTYGGNALFFNHSDFNLQLPSAPKKMYASDINGNGLTDLLVICNDGYKVFWNQGGADIDDMFSNNCVTTGTNLKDARFIYTGDFNGDGLLDILSNTQGYNDWYFYLGNGNGTFTQQLAISMSIISDQSFTDNDNDKVCANVVDFDCDGRSDIIITKGVYQEYYISPLHSIGVFDYVVTKWLCSSGTSLVERHSATSKNEGDMSASRYITGDFNGDGRVELVNYGYDCVNGVNANSDPVWRIYNSSGFTAQTGKITSITGDFGATTSITYSTLTDQSVYTLGVTEAYPTPRYTIPINVVRLTVQNNGAAGDLTTQYSYEGLKVHLRGRGLLGFSKTTANCTTTGVITETGITQWNTTYYIPSVTYTRSIIDSEYSQLTTTFTILNKGLKRYFAYPSTLVETDFDNHQVTTTNIVDTNTGMLTSESCDYGNNMYRTVEYGDYIIAGRRYQPQTIVSRQRHPDDNAEFTSTTKNSYDSTTGALLQRIDNYGKNKPLTTDYSYNVYGGLFSKSQSGTGIGYYVQYYNYDSTKRFVTKVYSSPAAYVTDYKYDVWGNMLTETDNSNPFNPITVNHTYDRWGNLIITRTPDGGEVIYSLGWNSDASRRWYVQEQGTARPTIKKWYDNQGREVLIESTGPNNVGQTDTTNYNCRGLVTRKTATRGILKLTHSYTYDLRGRLISETAPGDNKKDYEYDDRTVTVTENGNSNRTYTTTYDAWGNAKTVTDPATFIINTYKSNGGIKWTFAGGASWTFGYDDCGNRTSMTDPDADTTTYVYDAFGRETRRTDGRGVVFVTDYDYLGRVTRRTAGSDSIRYSYGTSGNGKLSLISESNGTWTKYFTYDSLKRVTSETMSNGTISKTKTYQYNSNGLLLQRTLPGGKVYEYTYDTYGYLTGVDFDSGTIEWNLTDFTGKRTTSATTIGTNSVYPFIKKTTLDNNGMLSIIQTSQNNHNYQVTAYTFSPLTGNLTTVQNVAPYYTPYNYSYDNADRLTGTENNNYNTMSMTYSANGNILSKTGIGSYDYSTTTRPHAVIAVDNTSGILSMNNQTVTYNSWGKVSGVSQTDNTDSYSHSIVYGPDLQRVTSVTAKNNSTLFEKFYWDDYEERKVGNDLYQYYYVSGSDGLAGLHIVKTSSNNQITTHTTKVITDHLGSIISLQESNNLWGSSYSASFDEWGRRSSSTYSFDPYFDRGYTGHEHLMSEFGLINMNGRMYDPNLGRFLSPDNYIQSPYNSQNYNRYSYCLNNPLKYTDSDGESWEAFLFDPVTFGLGNVLTHKIRGDIKTIPDGFKYFGQGFLTGAALSMTWSLAPCIPIVGDVFQAYMSGNAYISTGMMALGITSGGIRGLFTGDWSTLTNSLELMLGNYYIDENADFWEGVGQGYSRHTWESLQTTIGHGYSQARNLAWQIDRVDFMGGATYATTENKSFQNGVTLGNYININIWDEITDGFDDWVLSHPLYMHEYGHTIDSREFGPDYLFTIGWSSLNSARTSYSIGKRNTHNWHWTELRANNNASMYFQKHYKTVKWSKYTDFEESKKYEYYPLVAPNLPNNLYRR